MKVRLGLAVALCAVLASSALFLGCPASVPAVLTCGNSSQCPDTGGGARCCDQGACVDINRSPTHSCPPLNHDAPKIPVGTTTVATQGSVSVPITKDTQAGQTFQVARPAGQELVIPRDDKLTLTGSVVTLAGSPAPNPPGSLTLGITVVKDHCPTLPFSVLSLSVKVNSQGHFGPQTLFAPQVPG